MHIILYMQLMLNFKPIYCDAFKLFLKMEWLSNHRKGETDSDSNHGSHGPHDPAKAQQEQHQQFLGDASAALPNFGDIDTSVPFPEGITIDHIKSFEKMYREHAEAIVDVVVNLQFSLIEALWQGFWRNQPPDQLT